MAYEADVTVLGGLLITVSFTIEGPDREVGIFYSSVNDWEITHIAGRKCKKSPGWLYDRIEARKDEVERLKENLMCSN